MDVLVTYPTLRAALLKIWLSSFLKIESAYRYRKQECKKYREDHQDCSHNTQEAMLKSKIIFQEVFNCLLRLAINTDLLSHISILRRYQTIESPSERANPIIPHPPPWKLLQQFCQQFYHQRNNPQNILFGVQVT